MLQNVKVASFTVCELLRENQQGWGGGKIISHTPRLRKCVKFTAVRMIDIPENDLKGGCHFFILTRGLRRKEGIFY